MLKELLACRAEEVISPRLFQGQVKDRFQQIVFDQMIEEVTVIES